MSKRNLFVFVGSMLVGLGTYVVLKEIPKICPKSCNEKEHILPPDNKEAISASAKEFVERRRQRAMKKRVV